MNKRVIVSCIATVSLAILIATPAAADGVLFSTGNPDGLIGTLSRPSGPGLLETETADDFVLGQASQITQASFVGLLPSGAPLSSVNDVVIGIYHVFPMDSANPPSGSVPTRTNSPADTAFVALDGMAGTLSFTSTLLNPSFSVANTVVNGINKVPNQFTGGEGAATGEEVQVNVVFTSPILLSPGHYFFSPEVQLTGGNFLWLSAPNPIVPPGTPFTPDLQSWIRNDGTGELAPDWLRIGTDITHQGPFNATFSLSGETAAVPEPSTLLLLGTGVAVLATRRKHLVGM
jgi:hypothetical protein